MNCKADRGGDLDHLDWLALRSVRSVGRSQPMLSQTAEYALRAVVYLATTYPVPAPNHVVARDCNVPRDYLAKILLGLRENGLVASQRGKNGGFVLTRPADKISLREVVDCVDPVERVRECPRAVEEHCEELCPLHRFLDSAAVEVIKLLEGQTIAELANGTPRTFPHLV